MDPKKVSKPSNWPDNAYECKLENIYQKVNIFIDNPNFENKEVIISLVNDYDFNQSSWLGLFRTSEYEVYLINQLFIKALYINFKSLITYLYDYVGEKTYLNNRLSTIRNFKVESNIIEFDNLFPSLNLYYILYSNFLLKRGTSFSDVIIETFDSTLKYLREEKSKREYPNGVKSLLEDYTSLLNDISHFSSTKKNRIWAFTRDEIIVLFGYASKLMNESGCSAIDRPLKGVLKTCISNYILKSRYDYNENYICRYLPESVCEMSLRNQELWVSTIDNLNDDREQKVLSDFFNNGNWCGVDWVKNINFSSKRNYYVTSFSKSLNDVKMANDYGPCIYGFKNDRIASLISPIHYVFSKDKTKKIPKFTQVLSFDVLYDESEAKSEIQFLCKVIDYFKISDEEKKKFLEEILQYWILSVKDKKWSTENERRYVIFMYEEYNYIEINNEDSRYLKLKTTLLLYPDFILGKNPVKEQIKKLIVNKNENNKIVTYLFCEDCLSIDYDSTGGNDKKSDKCFICSSKNTKYYNKKIWL